MLANKLECYKTTSHVTLLTAVTAVGPYMINDFFAVTLYGNNIMIQLKKPDKLM